MPDEKQIPYSVAKKHRDMTGVTDPRKLLKSDTQKIDRNAYTPEQMWQASPKRGTESDIAGKRIQMI